MIIPGRDFVRLAWRGGLWLLMPAGAVALAGCGLGGPAHGPPAQDVAATVSMTNGLNFEPRIIQVGAGQTVEWRNVSLFSHTVTDDPAKAHNAADSELPPGAAPFSAHVAPGEIYRHTFTVPGRYSYFCIPHEGSHMTGTVVVEPPQ